MNDLLVSIVEQSRMARVESLGKEKAEADRSQLRAYLCAVFRLFGSAVLMESNGGGTGGKDQRHKNH